MNDYQTGNGIIGGQIYIIDNNTYNNIIPSSSGDATNTLTLSNAALTTSSSITSFFNNNQDDVVVGGLDSSVVEILLQDVNISLYKSYSTNETKELIKDNTKLVKIKCYGWDKYGRLLADIYVDNVNINLEMIKNNYGIEYHGKTKPIHISI